MTRLAPTFFFLGVAWLAALSFAAAWPDMEAGVFDAGTSSSADGRIKSLRCPIMITADETARVTARFTNSADQPESFLVRSRISEGFVTMVREDTEQVTIEPGADVEFSWPISAADAVFGRMVLVRVLATRSALSPARESACGTLVLGIPGASISGRWLFIPSVLIGLTLVGAGGGAWLARKRPLLGRERSTARRVGLLSLIILGSLAYGIAGLWLPSHLLLLMAALFVVLILEDVFGVFS